MEMPCVAGDVAGTEVWAPAAHPPELARPSDLGGADLKVTGVLK